MALDVLKDRHKTYTNQNIPVYKPIIIMISGGTATDDIRDAARRIAEEENRGDNERFKFFAVCAPGSNKNMLLTITRRVVELRYAEFAEIFDWFCEIIVSTASGNVDDKPALPKLPNNARRASL